MSRYTYTSLGTEIPPAPLIEVKLSTPGDNPLQTLNCTAFLDSGSDCTLVPLDLLIKVNAVVSGARAVVQGTSQGKTIVIPYFVGLSFDRFVYPAIQVRGCSSEALGGIILIGRDLLNNFILELNGKELTFTIT